jgi:Na+-transporting methylmalonyl-CoA/oxaloacetate decarboxylase gamma subunit
MFLHDILVFLVVEILIVVFWVMAQCISYVSSSTTLVTTPETIYYHNFKICIIMH